MKRERKLSTKVCVTDFGEEEQGMTQEEPGEGDRRWGVECASKTALFF